MKKSAISILAVLMACMFLLTACSSTLIENEAAKQAAFDHAGVEQADVLNVQIALEKTGRKAVYEISFETASTEYEYQVNAKNGKIVSFSQEARTNTGAPEPNTDMLGLEVAKTIALEHANVSAQDATFTKTESEYEDGRHVYELEFRTGRTEYEYVIDAATGEVLSSESEAIRGSGETVTKRKWK